MNESIPHPPSRQRNRQRAVAALLALTLLGGVAIGRGTATVNPFALHPPTPPAATSISNQVALTDPTAPEAAIQQVIQRGNDEQVQAIAAHDPALMQDTSTGDYYQQLVKVNQDLLDHGVSSIALLKLEWGPIAVNGTSATATTFETWSTTFQDGTTEQSRDQNDYTLVQDQGAWKIQKDDHPDGASNTPTDQSGAPAPPRAIGPGTSSNWSGYAATGGSFTAVNGTWTVPQPNVDGTAGADAIWVGIGGYRSRDLIQAGTEEQVSGSGAVRDSAWIETLPQPSHTVPLAVHPGDSVNVSISQTGTDTWQVAFTNHTTGQTYQQQVQYTSNLSSAEWVEEAPSGRGGIVPLDDFGTVQFSDATAVKDGQTVTVGAAGAHAITMRNEAGQGLAVPSSIGDDGASFSVARTTASSVPGRGLSPFPRGRQPGG